MNKVFKIIGLVCIVVGAVISAIFNYTVADLVGIAVAFLGAGIEAISVYKSAENKDWKLVLAIVLMAVGGLCCAFAGIAEATITQIITTVAGLVILITGLFTSIFAITNKTDKTE